MGKKKKKKKKVVPFEPVSRDSNAGVWVIAMFLLVSSLGLLFVKWHQDDIENSLRDTKEYVKELEIVSMDEEEVSKVGSYMFMPVPYTVTEWYFTVRYSNSLDGTAQIQVREETFAKYKVGDMAPVQVSEVYYVGEGKNYLESYELKLVKE